MCALSYIKQIQNLSFHEFPRARMIESLLHLLQERDLYTAGHNQRVGEIAGYLAHAMGLADCDVAMIKEAGYLHDIGKIFIPLSSIYKKGALSDTEYQEMKNHPQLGADLIQHLNPLHDLLEGVLYHHERFDGLGYPYGLQGVEIPLSARIIAIADTFDAMTSDRSYRKALSLEQSLVELKRAAGTQLDPTLVDIYLSLDLSAFML